MTYLPHTALETMGGLLDAASPALRAWLLHPEGFYPWGRAQYPDAKPDYTYARIADTVKVFHQARFYDDADKILTARATALYVARLSDVDAIDAARKQVDRYAKSLKTLEAATAGTNPARLRDAQAALLADYALAVETMVLLRTCTAMLLDAFGTVVAPGAGKTALVLDVKHTRAADKRLRGVMDKLRDIERSGGGELPITRLARWRGILLLDTPIPANEIRGFLTALNGRWAGLSPTALRAVLRSLDGALAKITEGWVEFLRDLAPLRDGLDLRLPFGRPRYYAGDTPTGRTLRLVNRRKVSLEGFDLTLNGEIDIPARRAEEIRDRLRPVLAQYRRQTQRYFPALSAQLTPHLDIWFYNAFGDATPGGHHYGSGRGIAIYPRNYRWFDAAEPTPGQRDKVVQTIAHEAGHRIWTTVLNERQREAWTALVTQQAPIDYDALLAAFAEREDYVRTVLDLLPHLKRTRPDLAIQVEIASSIYDPEYAKKADSTSWRYMNPNTHKGDPRPLFWFTREEIKALRDTQEQRKVPVFPITGYAATNPEEAWCDAFGNLMAYGPMAVLEPIRALIYRFFPTIRRNPEHDTDTP